MMIPSGVELAEALELLRRDIEFLHHRGYPLKGAEPVRCTPGCFPADLIQKYKNCRHKGNSVGTQARHSLSYTCLMSAIHTKLLHMHEINNIGLQELPSLYDD